MKRRSLVAATLLLGVGAFTTGGCGIFSSGDCTDLALCPDQAGDEGGSDGTTSDGSGSPDVQLDTLVAPDSNDADTTDAADAEQGDSSDASRDGSRDASIDAGPCGVCTSGYTCCTNIANSKYSHCCTLAFCGGSCL